MSAGHFHVHGPHDHEVEHAAHSADPFAGRIAVMTAILATIGALFGYMAGATQNDALMFKNEAAIRRTEASDQWNFYQAKSMKQNIAEIAAATATDPKVAQKYAAEAKRYEAEKKEVMVEAKKHEAAYKQWNEKSEHALHPHHWLAMSMTLLQIAIALASITVLTQKRWLLYGAAASAFVGAILGVVAWL